MKFKISKRDEIGLSSRKEELYVQFPTNTFFDKEFRVKYLMNKSLFWEQLLQIDSTDSGLTQAINNIAGAAKEGSIVATGISVGI